MIVDPQKERPLEKGGRLSRTFFEIRI